MLDFEITPRIRDCLQDEPIFSDPLLAKYREESAKVIPFDVLLSMVEILQKGTGDVRYFHQLIEGSTVVHPIIEEPPSDLSPQQQAEKEARLIRLKAEQEHRDYLRMTKNIQSDRKHMETLNAGRELQGAKDAISIGINMIVSAVTLFVAGYWGFNKAFGDQIMV
eukprot:TRINITY_DN4230_c0_g1_i1.p1 TRINITY_DN4230_c0_g1~~TRINITY_DN4230_c0_g1_i1.p1  ORF type:complete len:165 (+),score=30.22 TRINITY_DN4230_c0_g1_i1:75-569(+)